MSEERRGGCLCGAVRYRCAGTPQSVGICQCERCQRQSGSSYLIAVVFPRTAVEIEESALATYAARIDGENELRRHFCPTCGSAVMITLDRYPDIRSIMGGTLDDKDDLRPTFSLWCTNAQPWVVLPEAMERFEAYPDGVIA